MKIDFFNDLVLWFKTKMNKYNFLAVLDVCYNFLFKKRSFIFVGYFVFNLK